MLLDVLKNKQCFKLVCGAGNEDVDEIEKLAALYSKAGCNFIDLCAKPEIVNAAKRGLKRVGTEGKCSLCVSVGDENDQHFCKAKIDENSCINCGQCEKVCGQNAIENNATYHKINQIKCIGCSKCIEVCPNKAINLAKEEKDIEKILYPLVGMVDSVEFHIIGNEGDLIYENWDKINKLFNGPLSISINRAVSGDKQLTEIMSKLIEKRTPYTTIIQADGIPMSGGKDSFKSTLQAIATADLFKGMNLPVYVITSGGTNSKTTELAKLCEVDIDGIAIGSYARKIVKEYTQRDDFFTNETVFNNALTIAKDLVEVSLKNLL